MEAFLNFLWALTAIAAVWAWRACWMRQYRARRRDPVREWAAVVCALVLLFFAVSLSDDLHASVVLLDESAAGSRHSAVWDAHHPAREVLQSQPAQAVVLWGFVAFIAPLASFAPFSSAQRSIFDSLQTMLSCGRAPPLFSL